MTRVIDRVELKTKAKGVLKRFFPLLFVVSLVIAFTGGDNWGNGSSNGSSNNVTSSSTYIINSGGIRLNNDILRIGDQTVISFDSLGSSSVSLSNTTVGRVVDRIPMGGFIKSIITFGTAAVMAVATCALIILIIFLAYPIKVGCRKIFIETSETGQKPVLRDMIYAFRSGRLGNIVLTGFLTGLYTFLWSLLFIFPGIVKSYAYRMVPYIQAHNPDMAANDVIRLSSEMTKGHKFDMFVLDLSFIGWYILGSIPFGLGVFLVNPYKDATMAQLYLRLRDNAIYTNIALPENFGLYDTAYDSHEPAPQSNPQQQSNDIVDYRDKPFEK